MIAITTKRISTVFIGIAAVITLTAASTPAQRALLAARDTATPSTTGPILSSSDDLRFSRSIEIQDQTDAFSRIKRFSTTGSVAELEDGSYISWQYRTAPSQAGIASIVGLASVTTGPTLASVGIALPSALPKAVPAPPQGECAVIDAAELKRPGAVLPYVAACAISDSRGATKLITYNSSGQVKVIGTHPLRVAKISTGRGLHAAGPTLTLITSPDRKGTMYMQWYFWRSL